MTHGDIWVDKVAMMGSIGLGGKVGHVVPRVQLVVGRFFQSVELF